MKRYDEQKFQTISEAFKQYPNFSDRALARVTGISPTTIGRYRAIRGVSADNRVEASGRKARGRLPYFKYYEEQLLDDTTTIYRAYNDQKELLYVGASFSFMQRLAMHNNKKPWWRDVTNVTTTHFDERQDALIAERMAIRTEQPRYNVIGKTGRLLPDAMLARALRTGVVSRETPAPPPAVKPPPRTPTDGTKLVRRPTGRVLV